MVKPLSDIPNSTPSKPSDSGSYSGRRLSDIKKRTRDSETIDDGVAYPSKHAKYTEDSYKTRRVNPERLALRLDPELVAEMDALIIPGAKMPTFAVRKDFQERYKVDRRHIYDYFHSRGLRVAKEDKHNNLTWALSLNARKLPIEPKTVPHEECVERGGHEEHEGQEITDGDSEKSNRQASDQLPQEPRVRSAKRLASAKILAGIVCRRINSRSQIVHKTPKRSSFSEVHSPSPAAEDDSNQTDLAVSPLPDFTLPEEFPDTPLLDEDTWDPMSDSPSEHLPGFPDLDLWYDYSIDLPLERGELDPIMSVNENRSLTEEERMEFYNLIDKSISPPNGVEECSGTYGAYMKERSRFYFDRLFSKGSQGQSKLYHSNLENRGADTSPRETGDFRKWLSNVASQHSVRAVAQVQTDDNTDLAVSNHFRDHRQASGGLQYPNLRPYILNIASPVWEHEINKNSFNKNSFDDRIASSPSRRLFAPSIFTRSTTHCNPALLVPAATMHYSSGKLTDDDATKRSDASRCKLVPLNHGSPGFLRHHVRPNRLRTASAGCEI